MANISRCFLSMRKLVDRIEAELKEQNVCAVYNSELARVWPKKISPEKRRKEIKRFADKRNLEVTFYEIGLCAVFEKPRGASPAHEIILPLPLPKRRRRTRKHRKK
jgi:hypothetical protein